jgi:hypothetical protein
MNVNRKPFLLIVLMLSGCNPFQDRVNYHDQRMKPFWEAISLVPRDSLGFTPISQNSDIRLEGKSKYYDVMLHIYHKTSRTIAFRKIVNGYVWIGEQEIHTGPRRYDSPDGTFNETITLTYDVDPISGFPVNRLSIHYDGPDSTLLGRDLELRNVLPIITKWDELEINKPSS